MCSSASTTLLLALFIARAGVILSLRVPQKRPIARIGVITSGGDCPSLNAAIRAVVKTAGTKGVEVMGLPNGFPGLLHDPPRAFPLDDSYSSPQMLLRGGSRLGGYVRADYEPFDNLTTEEKASRITASLRNLQIDGIIETGGDGSLFSATKLLSSVPDVAFVGIPKTIDNDVPETIYSLGFQSAVSMAAEGISRVRDTAESHRRVAVVEVMGREAGFLTLHAAIAGGADAILIPEFPYDGAAFLNHLSHIYAQHDCAIVAVSESIGLPTTGEAAQYRTADGSTRFGGSGEAIAHFIAGELGVDARHCVLGHLQRGGTPNAFDQTLASTLGAHAVNELCSGASGVFVSWNGAGGIECVPLSKLEGKTKRVTASYPELVAAQSMGIYCGTVL